MRQRHQCPHPELPFEAEPDVHRNPQHREQDRLRPVGGKLFRHFARDRFAGADRRPRIGFGNECLDLGHHHVRHGIGARRLGQADLVGAVIAKFGDRRLADCKRVHLAAQILDVDRLGEGHADHLPAGEIDAQVEPAIGGEAERQDRGDRRQHHRQVAPAHEVEVGMVGDEFEQLHVPGLKYAACAGGRGATTAPPACA